MTITPEALAGAMAAIIRAADGDYSPSHEAVSAIATALRTGHLVLVDDAAVERVAELVELSLLRHGVHQTAVEGTRDDAKDILAALQVKP